MKELLKKLFDHKALSQDEARRLLELITTAQASEVEVVAAISALKMREIEVDEIKGFRNALLDLAVKPELYTNEAIDVCGTGGDAKDTFNISTLAALVIAASGYKVVKHGNYGVSSLVGSSSILEKSGYEFTVQNEILNAQLEQCNITFLHAPLFHPALKNVASIRKQLGIRTFFNYLGPLVNPAQPKYQLTGVYDLQLLRVYADILRTERTHFKVIHNIDGYDEVSCTAAFKIIDPHSIQIKFPDQLGQEIIAPATIGSGGSLQSSLQIFNNVLKGEATKEQMQVVAVNAGLGIHCFKPEETIESCISEALQTIKSGIAAENYKQLKQIKEHQKIAVS